MKNHEEIKASIDKVIKDYNKTIKILEHKQHRSDQIEKIKHETKIYKILFKKHIFLS
jgi:hypothetical protein